MKILGIGVDIIENNRIKNGIRNFNFLKRIYSTKELRQSKLSKNKTNFFVKRFVAKEALAKAIGSAFRNNLNFADIEIINDKMGKPYYLKNNKIKNLIKKKFNVKNFECFLSISDEKKYSTAFAIIQKI